MEFTLDGAADRRRRPQAVRRALHPRRRLRGPARCPGGRPQPQPGRDSRSASPARRCARSCTCAHRWGPRCRSGIPAHAFGDTNLLVTDHADGPRPGGRARRSRPVALMRGHGCVVAGGSLREVVFNVDLPGAERGAAACGRSALGRDHVPQRRRSPRDSRARAARSRSSARGSTGASAPGRPYDEPADGRTARAGLDARGRSACATSGALAPRPQRRKPAASVRATWPRDAPLLRRRRCLRTARSDPAATSRVSTRPCDSARPARASRRAPTGRPRSSRSA